MSRHARTLSPTQSVSSHATPMSNNFPRIVSRVSIVGQAEREEGGASIQLYLKLSVPVDSVTPGSTIPLFAEDNIKILEYQVHPLDSSGAPYFYAPNTSPLLQSASRALSLPIPSSKTYLSQFSQNTSSSRLSPQVMDERHTGQILVSGYAVSFVLPKEFPPRRVNESGIQGRRGSLSLSASANSQQFVAALDIWVPYLSQPTRAPFSLSLPVPRCLSNTIDLRLFAADPPSRSFESLESGDSVSWDLTCDPAVTPSSRVSQSYYEDERGEGEEIIGTFPSCDRLRIRWAAPARSAMAADGRKRVGTTDVKGEMTTVVLGRETRGVLLGLEFKATCRDLWYPGVATLLGLDVSLVAKGSDVEWAPGGSRKWTISGTSGYEGFDTGPVKASRQASSDMFVSPSSPNGRLSSLQLPLRKDLMSGQSSSSSSAASSTASLLRQPLPAANTVDYSFEGPGPTPAASLASLAPSGTLSSISSLDKPTSDENSPQDDNSPGTITIHVNMNELLHPGQNILTFTISGTVLVIPRARSRSTNNSGYRSSASGSSSSSPVVDNNADINDPEAFVLPKFTVLAADVENTVTVLRNDSNNGDVDVFSSSGDIRSAQARKTVLQKGATTRCGNDGARIAFRPILVPTHRSSFAQIKGEREEPRIPSPEQSSRHRPAPANGILRRVSSSSSMRSTPQPHTIALPTVSSPLSFESQETSSVYVPPKLHAKKGLRPKLIPSVEVNVKLLSERIYAVQLRLPAPPDQELEFGLALSNSRSIGRRPKVEILCASVEGVSVQYHSTGDEDDELDQRKPDDTKALTFEIGAKQEWARWVKVDSQGGGMLVFEYIVREGQPDPAATSDKKGKTKADNRVTDILLPTFAMPVGKLEINIEDHSACSITDLRTNLAHQLSPTQAEVGIRRLAHYSLPAFFYPHLSFALQPPRRTIFSSLSMQDILFTLLLMAILISTLTLARELHTVRDKMDAGTSTIVYQAQLGPTPANLPPGDWWTAEPERERSWPTKPASASGSSVPDPYFDELDSVAAYVPPEPQAISLVSAFPSLWPSELDLDFERTARKAVDYMVYGLGIVWRVVKKVYHYPLDPSDS